ncbi:MAG: oxidoreductase [Hyphomonas sp.]|uniref:NAD(P)H-dependent flavin oxidoreductase n=1 Tax=Hyphomonas sp. TaxID=87 RepID=UPI000C63FB7B|nr:nitronate monooxygenase [Hyphomonas sp.]MAM07128.1 oxidoreductase [Hyphomonas sp.]
MKTRLTERLGIAHPVIQAPMAFAAGGALAKAVSKAGALGMIGGGYGDAAWIEEQFAVASGGRIGCGFITWALAEKPELLDQAIELGAAAIFLSFGDPAPFAEKVRLADVPLICQIQTLRDARRAIEVGADVIVAQGAEAGGHGETRGTMALVPEIADEIARAGSAAVLCAAGGIADGRGLAASLMLGADGVVVGTRFWAAAEALAHPKIVAAALSADGDATLRTRVVDIVREIKWSERYSGRVLSNAFIQRWHGHENQLVRGIKVEAASWVRAQESGDTTIAAPFVGEAIGLVHDAPGAEDIVYSIVTSSRKLLACFDNVEA